MTAKRKWEIGAGLALFVAVVGISAVVLYTQHLNSQLAQAIVNHDMQAIETLVRQGASIHTTDSSGHTPLMVAAIEGDDALLRLLIARGASVDEQNKRSDTALHYAASHGHIHIVSELLARGAQVDARDQEGWTALSTVAYLGEVDDDVLSMVKLLLAYGADPNSRNNDGETAPKQARQNGLPRIACLLEDAARARKQR